MAPAIIAFTRVIWLSGNVVGHINKVTLCRAGLVLRSVTFRGNDRMRLSFGSFLRLYVVYNRLYTFVYYVWQQMLDI